MDINPDSAEWAANNAEINDIFDTAFDQVVKQITHQTDLDPLVISVGLLQHSFAALIRINRTDAVKMVRAYADCMEQEFGSAEYRASRRRCLIAQEDLERIWTTKLEARQAAGGAVQ
jgi:hypothetical protein